MSRFLSFTSLRTLSVAALAGAALLWNLAHATSASPAIVLAPNCANTYVPGLTAITDLGTGTYSADGATMQGGLYPSGQNARPMAFEADGVYLATHSIFPRNAAGASDPANGKIGFAALGMSTTNYVADGFIRQIAATPGVVNPKVVIVNGGINGIGASHWKDPNDAVWATFQSRLAAAGIAGPQLQAVWILLSEREQILGTDFRTATTTLRDWIKLTVLSLKSKYPNVKITYLTGLPYQGYTDPSYTFVTNEPNGYESNFAPKLVIQAQIQGDASLRYQFNGTPPPAPWLSWGPYLWTNGLGPDGVYGANTIPGRYLPTPFEARCEDYRTSDGYHPASPGFPGYMPGFGADVYGGLLFDFMTTDPTSTPWFLAP